MAGATYVAGHTGLIGRAVVEALRRRGQEPLTVPHGELDLTNQAAVEEFFASHRPERVFLLAGRVGGIKANSSHPTDFLAENLLIATNVMLSAGRHGTRRLIFAASACMYPKDCPQPITPDSLFCGRPEESSLPFATAKLAGVMLADSLCRQRGVEFFSVVPATCYGPGDRFSDEGHVIGSMMARMHAAKQRGENEFVLWGTGTPRREFIYSADLAEALVTLMERSRVCSDVGCTPKAGANRCAAQNAAHPTGLDAAHLPTAQVWHPPDPNVGIPIIHIGSGEEVSMLELAQQMAETIDYRGRIVCDTSRPDGMPRRLLDSGPIRSLGWRPKVTLSEGLRLTYDWYCRSGDGGRA